MKNSKGVTGIVKRENSPYGNKKWHLIIDLPNGKSSQWYSTQREAEDELKHFADKDPDMYTRGR